MTFPTNKAELREGLHVIVGATGVGKSAYALQLAEQNGLPIISADARQIYSGMSIGTDAPSSAVMERVPHYFVSHLPVTSPYSAHNYAQEARTVIQREIELHHRAIVVGGSMLYISALLYGIDPIPEPVPEVRDRLWQQYHDSGLLPLRQQLERIDPGYLSKIDPNNHKRIIRALEVYESSGRPFSSYHTGRRPIQLPYAVHLTGITRSRADLYHRIEERVQQMITSGLVDEVRALMPYRHLNALNTIGYKEIFGHLDGLYSLDEAAKMIIKHTKVYARQQISYFDRMEDTHWLEL